MDSDFSNRIGTAPQALNTLQELASALRNDGCYAATLQNQLATKANQSTAYTKLKLVQYYTIKLRIYHSIRIVLKPKKIHHWF